VARLISKNKTDFSPKEQKELNDIADRISKMSRDGIWFEVCSLALRAFGVDAASILPEIKPISIGWVSLIGYQSQGYAFVPNQ